MPSLGDQESLEQIMERLGQGPGKPGGSMPGNGGISRGPGTAPITYGDKQNLKTRNLETVQGSKDMSRAAPGEILAIGETEHDDQNTPSVRQSGGALSNSAKGGDAVWRESLTPDEKALLKRYFK